MHNIPVGANRANRHFSPTRRRPVPDLAALRATRTMMSCCSSRPRPRSVAKPAAPNQSADLNSGGAASLGEPTAGAAVVSEPAKTVVRTNSRTPPRTNSRTPPREMKRVRATVVTKVTGVDIPQQASMENEQAVTLHEAMQMSSETQNTQRMPPLPRSTSLTKNGLLEQMHIQQVPSWRTPEPSTPQSVRSEQQESPLATPKSAPPPPAVLKTPDWLAVLKSQGLAAGSVTDSMRQPVPPSSTDKSAQGVGQYVTEETEESASEEEQEWLSVREIPPEHLSPAPSAVADNGPLLCKIEVEFNTKFGQWNSTTQGKLYAQLIAAGTDETFAKKVVMAMKENKGKVAVRGPMVNHGPAYTVFRSIPALNVGLQTPSKVDQSATRGRGQAAPPPLRTAGPCAVTRLPGQPKQKSEKKPKETGPSKTGGILRRNKKGMPIVKARVISPPRGTAARSSSADGAAPPALPTRDTVKPISAAQSLFDRNGRPRGDPLFAETPLARSSSEVSVFTPGNDRPKVGVRALRSPARLVAESFQRGIKLQGREFKVLAEVAVTKLVMPSSSEVATLQPGQLVVAIDNAWWHGPRIKLQLPVTDGMDGGTGWASLCSTHGDYMLIPVVDLETAEKLEQAGNENAAPVSSHETPGLGDKLAGRKTARRALGLVQDGNGVTPQAISKMQRTNSRPVSLELTPGREGDI